MLGPKVQRRSGPGPPRPADHASKSTSSSPASTSPAPVHGTGIPTSWPSPSGPGHHAAILSARRGRPGTQSLPAKTPPAAPPSSPACVRCRPRQETVFDEAAAAMAPIENIQREDLNPLEEAQGPQTRLTEGLTHEANRPGRRSLAQRRQQFVAPLNPRRPSRTCSWPATSTWARPRPARPRRRPADHHRQRIAINTPVREAEPARRQSTRRCPPDPVRVKNDRPATYCAWRKNSPTSLAATIEIRVKRTKRSGAEVANWRYGCVAGWYPGLAGQTAGLKTA